MRGNKIAPLPSLGTFAKGVQFYCRSRNYPEIPYCTIFPFLAHFANKADKKKTKRMREWMQFYKSLILIKTWEKKFGNNFCAEHFMYVCIYYFQLYSHVVHIEVTRYLQVNYKRKIDEIYVVCNFTQCQKIFFPIQIEINYKCL